MQTSVVALLGLALAILSLAWQAYTFIQSGARIDVRVTLITASDERGMIQYADNISPESLDSEDGTAMLLATIYNVGRMPVTVQQCRWGAGKSMVMTTSPVARWPATQLPYRLEPHAQCTSTIPLASARGMASMSGSGKVWPIIVLGNGKTVCGKAFSMNRS